MKLKWGLSFVFFIVCLGFLTYSCYQNRVYDWDMPGYLGSILSWENPDNPQKVHQIVYSSIKKEASELEFHDIVAYNYANEVFAADYKAFDEQLPYYQIKLGFNVAVYALYKIGFSGPHSVLLVNIFSYFIAGLLLFYLVKFLFPSQYFIAPLVSLGILSLPPVKSMAENPTPDTFLFIFTLLFTINVLQNKNIWVRFIILVCCVLIRPDYILFAGTYLFAVIVFEFLYSSKKINYIAIIQGVVLASIYLSIITYYHYPGWKDLFYDSFFYRRPVISAENADFTAKRYLDFLFIKLINFKKISLASIILLGTLFYVTKDKWTRILGLLFYANIYIKFVFFPDSANLRFFIGFVILLFIVLLYAVSKKYNGFQIRKIA